MNPSDDWNSIWRENATAASENPAQHYRHFLIIKWLEELQFGRKGSMLIDFGSGQGDFLSKANQKFPGSTLVGFELSREGVLMTSRKVPTATVLEHNVFQQTAETEIFRSSATHATCSEVLEHLDDPGKFIQAMSRYLAPDAYLIITVPSGPISAFDRRIGHRQHFAVKQLRELVETNGFELFRVQRAGFPFHNLYRLIVIGRADRLIDDIRGIDAGCAQPARFVMRMFELLFRTNLPSTPWGWQLVALAKKRT
jgi:2-polyprenyl-3-methyl-5-hydroxy-6-metoxy-1,4-benzoquinol methylase